MNSREREFALQVAQQLVSGDLDASLTPSFSFVAANGKPGACDMRWFRSAEGDLLAIICTERKDNAGISITNAAPAPWQDAESELVASDEQVIWLEHRGPDTSVNGDHEFDLVIDATPVPKWKPLVRHPAPLARHAPTLAEAKEAESLSDTRFHSLGKTFGVIYFGLEDEDHEEMDGYVRVDTDGRVDLVMDDPEAGIATTIADVGPRQVASNAYLLANAFARERGARINRHEVLLATDISQPAAVA